MVFQPNSIASQAIGQGALADNGAPFGSLTLAADSSQIPHFGDAPGPLLLPDEVYSYVLDPSSSQLAHRATLSRAERNRQGFLFVTIHFTVNGQTQSLRLSDQWVDGGQYLWEQKLLSLPAIHFQAREQGGYIALNWGSVSFVADTFQSASPSGPPKEVGIQAQWGAKDSTAMLIFEGEAYLRSENDESLEYDLFEKEFSEEALAWGLAAGENTSVILVNSMTQLSGNQVEVEGGFAHQLAVEQAIYLQPVENNSSFSHTGKYLVVALHPTDPTRFIIEIPGFTGYDTMNGPAEFGQDLVPQPLVLGAVEQMLPQPTGVPSAKRFYRPNFLGAIGGATNSVAAFDDGLVVTSNFSQDNVSQPFVEPDPGGNPVGRFSLSGQADLDTLDDLFYWATTRLGLIYQKRDQPEAVSLQWVVTEQMLLVDLLDQVAGYCNFSFTIMAGVLSLFANDSAAASIGTFSEGDLYSLDYTHEMPTRLHRARWKVACPGQMRTNDSVLAPSFAPTLKEEEREVTLAGISPLGDVREYRVFDQNRLSVTQKLKALKAERDKPLIRASLPLEGLPRVGFSFEYLDHYHNPPQAVSVVVRDLRFDFESHAIELTGKATITPL